MWGYSNKLKRDVGRWREAGWVTAEGEAHILAEAAKGGGETRLASSLGILASVLLGFAVVSFVAAHWQDMTRGFRLGLLLALLWGAYGAAGLFAVRQARGFGDAAILFANAVFGASIALISQMYHIDGRPADGVLLWAGGAFLSGVTLRSNPALALALVLFCVWTGMEMIRTGAVHWPFLIAWGLVTAAFAWQRWRPGAQLSGLALAVFTVALGYYLRAGHAHALTAVLGCAVAAAAIATLNLWPKTEGVAAPALSYAIATAFAGLLGMQFIDYISAAGLAVLGALTLMFLLCSIAYGLWNSYRGALWLGYIGFSIEILALYWKTVGSLLDTSAFFLVAGVIVAALAFLATRLVHRRTKNTAVA